MARNPLIPFVKQVASCPHCHACGTMATDMLKMEKTIEEETYQLLEAAKEARDILEDGGTPHYPDALKRINAAIQVAEKEREEEWKRLRKLQESRNS